MANNPFLTGARGSKIANNPMTGKPAAGFDKTANPFLQGSRGSKTASNPFHQGSRGSAIAKNPMSTPELGRQPGQPADSGPLKTLTKPRKKITTVYPLNIRAVDHYITIGAFEKRHFPAFGEARSNTNIIQKVVLPMPTNLQAGYNQEYQNENIGVAGQFVGKALSEQPGGLKPFIDAARGGEGALDKGAAIFDAGTTFTAGTIDSLKSNITKGVALASAFKGIESDAFGLAGLAGGGVLGGLVAAGINKGAQAAFAAEGFAVNPHTSVIYDSPQMRSFNMEWELRPKNQQESIAISRIVAFFKFYSAPSFKPGMDNAFFEYPNQFKLKIKHDEFLFAFGDCVLTSFNVDYHGEGTPIYYDASGSIRSGNRRLKAPAVVRISTAWQETSIVTKEVIEEQGR